MPEMNVPFCDWLSVTVPRGTEEASRAIHRVLGPMGLFRSMETERMTGYAIGADQVYMEKAASKVTTHELSGKALTVLRGGELLERMCRALAMVPGIRVTRADVSMDVPEAGHEVIPELVRRHREERPVRLGRKVVPVGAESWVNRIDDYGRETGTAYFPRLGTRARYRLAVYDKRVERLEETGEDIGPRTRFEVRCKTPQAGVRLEDVVYPDALFWERASDVLSAPEVVPEWRRFDYPPRADDEMTDRNRVVERLKALDSHLEWLAEASVEAGPDAVRQMFEMLARRVNAFVERAEEERYGCGSPAMGDVASGPTSSPGSLFSETVAEGERGSPIPPEGRERPGYGRPGGLSDS